MYTNSTNNSYLVGLKYEIKTNKHLLKYYYPEYDNIKTTKQFIDSNKSIKEEKGDSLENMTIERAIELIKEKREEDKNKIIKTFDEDENMQLLNGRYGAYLKIGKKNFRLPKDVEPAELSYEQCVEISQNQQWKIAVQQSLPKQNLNSKKR